MAPPRRSERPGPSDTGGLGAAGLAWCPGAWWEPCCQLGAACPDLQGRLTPSRREEGGGAGAGRPLAWTDGVWETPWEAEDSRRPAWQGRRGDGQQEVHLGTERARDEATWARASGGGKGTAGPALGHP